MHLRNKLLATGRFLAILPTYAVKLSGKSPSLKTLPVESDNIASFYGNAALRSLSGRSASGAQPKGAPITSIPPCDGRPSSMQIS
jgi:hypothetical protein